MMPVYPRTMVNMSAMFNEEAHKGLVIMFTSLFPYTCMSIVTLTSDLQYQ